MSTLAKSPLVLLAAATALLAFGPTPDFAGGLPATQSQTTVAAHNAEVVSRARRAFLRFTAACLAHDRSRIAQTVTDDVVLEYELPDPGITLTVDSDALDSLCSASAPGETTAQISGLLIFPMTDPNTVFIQYEGHMAIVQLRGDRIAKIRDFTTGPGEIAGIATGSAHNTIP